MFLFLFQCYLKCIADSNRLIVNGTVDRQELFQSVIQDLATELIVVWTHVLNLAIYTCTDEGMDIICEQLKGPVHITMSLLFQIWSHPYLLPTLMNALPIFLLHLAAFIQLCLK